MKALAFGAVLAAMILSGCAVVPEDQPAPVASPNGECDPIMVQTYPMVGGVSLRVVAPAPNVVRVDVWNHKEHRRQVQQVNAGGPGAVFSSWGFHGDFTHIDVTTRTGDTCTVAKAALDSLNAMER